VSHLTYPETDSIFFPRTVCKIYLHGVFMITKNLSSFSLITLTLLLSGCSLMSLTNPATPEVTPSSTTVSTGQNMTFQVYGGTPPYQYQSNGVGTIDSSGNYQSGTGTGQSQIIVTDANGATGSANVSVVQSGTTTSYGNTVGTDSNDYAEGWSATNKAQLKTAPLVQGQVLADTERTIDSQGDQVHSKFLKTNLKHSIVRLDELVEKKQIVAVHAVIEDQFVVKLQDGHSEKDLSAVLNSTDAHISERLKDPGTYLISMNQRGATTVSSQFLAKRTFLKRWLKTIAVVTPNTVSRAPAGETSVRN
jgi:hypothetical protein